LYSGNLSPEETAQELCNRLNKGSGFRPLSEAEFASQLSHTEKPVFIDSKRSDFNNSMEVQLL